jgi:hypothetical protein
MISQDELRRALDLPVDASDREIATAMAAQAGFAEPTEDATIRFICGTAEVHAQRVLGDRLCSLPPRIGVHFR